MTWNELLHDMSKELNIAHIKLEELQMKQKKITKKKQTLQKTYLSNQPTDFMSLISKGLTNFLSSPFK